MSTTRENILLATCRLLERQGYPATGINEVVKESGTPKGSLYYYFPGGKEQIVSEAVRYAGGRLVERMRTELDRVEDPLLALHAYVLQLADKIEEKRFAAGNPLMIVAVEAAGVSPAISQACREVYEGMEAVLREKLAGCGLPTTEAAEQARLTLASLEGGIILSRIHATADPLRAIARHLQQPRPPTRPSSD